MQSYFNETYYLNAKLKQLNATGETDADGNTYTLSTLQQSIADAGMTPEQHYQTYGREEQLSPNAYFNENEYLAAKLDQMKNNPDPAVAAEWANKSVADLAQAISDAGMTPASHYELYGAFETRADGTLINPSNAFDANAYAAAKLQQMIEKGEELNGKPADQLTVVDVMQALQEAGLSPVTHYQNFGATEAADSKVALVQTVPSEQRVPNDPAREDITGENVPSNYNPPSAGPENAQPGAVSKPADVGGLAPEDVSPPVSVPTTPVKVPGDNGYLRPPANLVDSNDRPVLPPSTEGTGNATDNWVTVNPDGSATVTQPNGDPAGTLPPGSMDPANPVVPDVTPTPPSPENPGGGGEEGGPDVAAPTLVSAAVAAGGASLTLTFNEALAEGIDAGHFEVVLRDAEGNLTNTTLSVAAVALDASGKVLTLTLPQGQSIGQGLTPVIVYSGDSIKDLADNVVDGSTTAVEWNSTASNTPTSHEYNTLAGMEAAKDWIGAGDNVLLKDALTGDYTDNIGVNNTVTVNGTATAGTSLDLGLGDDRVNLSGTLEAITLNGGEGTDMLNIKGDVDISAATVTGFEGISFGAAGTLSLTAGQLSGLETVSGSAGNVVDALKITANAADSSIDLSGLSFSNWTDGTDTVEVATTAGRTGALSITASNVSDTFVIGQGHSGLNLDDVVTINGFGTTANNTDSLKLGVTALNNATELSLTSDSSVTFTLTDGVVSFTANGGNVTTEHLAEIYNLLAAADGNASTGAIIVNLGEDSYVVADLSATDSTATDIIKLSGVEATGDILI